MLSEKRVLVIEPEFLVALDIQRILEDAHAERTVFARSVEEAAALAPHFHEYDLAIIDIGIDSLTGIALGRQLLAAGIAVVATASEAAARHRLPGLVGVPAVAKPFSDVDLLSACVTALALQPDRG